VVAELECVVKDLVADTRQKSLHDAHRHIDREPQELKPACHVVQHTKQRGGECDRKYGRGPHLIVKLRTLEEVLLEVGARTQLLRGRIWEVQLCSDVGSQNGDETAVEDRRRQIRAPDANLHAATAGHEQPEKRGRGHVHLDADCTVLGECIIEHHHAVRATHAEHQQVVHDARSDRAEQRRLLVELEAVGGALHR